MAEGKAPGLTERVGGSRDIAVIAPVKDGDDLAAFKQRIPAAENEIDRSFDPAVYKALGKEPIRAKLIWQETVVARDEIPRQRPEKQRILRGAKRAFFHIKAVTVYVQRHFLSLHGRVKRVVDDGKIFHLHSVGADGQRPGTEGVELLPVGVDLFCIVAPEQHGLIGTRTLQKEVRCPEHELLPVDPGLEANQ